MKKICIILPFILPVPNVKGGAIETLITNLIDENEVQNKIQFTIISIYEKKAYEISKKYMHTEFIYIKKNIFTKIINRISMKIRKESYYNLIAIKQIMNKKKFDYIIVEGGGADTTFSRLLKIGYKNSNLISHIHHHMKADEKIEKIFGKIITISEFCKSQWLEKSNKNKEDVIVLKNGIDLTKFDKEVKKEEREHMRSKLGFKEDDFIVLYCGRLIEVKGVRELIKAIISIKNKNIKLLVVGSPNFALKSESEYVNELKNISENANDKVKFVGYVDNNELYKYYKLSDIMVIPSLWEEAAGLVCIEGMITKTPLIITKSGGMVEYVNNNSIIIEKNQNIVKNIEDAILKLYNAQGNIIENIKSEQYQRAQLFSSQNYYKDFVDIIERLE